MMTEPPDDNIQADDVEPSPWFCEALAAAQMSERFERRCLDAGALAHSVAVIREERERQGFLAVPLADMLRALAELAAVPLEPILRWCGAVSLQDAAPESSGALARLAGRLGFDLREIEALLRLSVARELGYASLPLLVARRQTGAFERGELDACEAALGEIEARYSQAHRERLCSVLESARAAVRDAGKPA